MAATGRKDGGDTPNRSDLEEDIRKLREDLSRLMEHLGETGEDSAADMREAVGQRVEKMREQGEAAIGRLKNGAQDIEHEIVETLHERPITSLAVAAGVGYVLAMLSRR